jgi:hypothetical protein
MLEERHIASKKIFSLKNIVIKLSVGQEVRNTVCNNTFP